MTVTILPQAELDYTPRNSANETTGSNCGAEMMDKAAREQAREIIAAIRKWVSSPCDFNYKVLRQLGEGIRIAGEALDALDSADSDNARLQTQAATNTRCKWGGGNDYLACLTCGLEYDYRKEERPACGAEATITRLRARVSELAAAQGWRPTSTVLAEAMATNDGWIPKSLFAYRKNYGYHVMTGQCDDGSIWLGYDDNGACFDVAVPDMIALLPAPPVGDR